MSEVDVTDADAFLEAIVDDALDKYPIDDGKIESFKAKEARIEREEPLENKIRAECKELREEVERLRSRVGELERKEGPTSRPVRNWNRQSDSQLRMMTNSPSSTRRRNQNIEPIQENSVNLNDSRSYSNQFSPGDPRTNYRTRVIQTTYRNSPTEGLYRSFERIENQTDWKQYPRPETFTRTSDFRLGESLQRGGNTMTFGQRRDDLTRPGNRVSDRYSNPQQFQSSGVQPPISTSEVFFGNYKELRLQRFESFHKKLGDLMKDLGVEDAFVDHHSQEGELKSQWRFIKDLVTGMTNVGRQRRDNEARAPPSYVSTRTRVLRYN